MTTKPTSLAPFARNPWAVNWRWRLINDPTLVPLMTPLGIDAYINPRATTVSSILRHIRHGRVRDVYSLGDAEAEIIEAEVLSTSPSQANRSETLISPKAC